MKTERKAYSDQEKKRLNFAFKLMRDQGLIARQNFLCCQSCGCAAIDRKLKDMTDDEYQSTRGYCFYHQQDMDGLRKDGTVYLAYGTSELDNSTRVQENPITAVEVGKIICACLDEADLKYTWDGTEDERIFVHVKKSGVFA